MSSGSIFEHNGLMCKTILTSMGHWCGYVMVPTSHRLHGKHYSDKVEVPQSVIDRPIDVDDVGVINLMCADFSEGDTSIDLVLAVDVHGGLTFSGDMGKTGDHWLGFDCAHSGDARSPDHEDEHNTYRDEAYVKSNCKRLADQIVALT